MAAVGEDRSAEHNTLRSGALGAVGIVFVVVAGAAPLTAMAGNVPLGMSIGNGVGLPGAYVLVGVALLLFSVGFAALSRHLVNAGAFYAYIEFGLGRAAGRFAAYLATLGYNASVTSLTAAFAFFSTSALRDQAGIDLPWEPLAVFAILLAAALSYFGIAVSASLLAVLMALELGLVVAVDVAVLVQHTGGFSLEVFAPQHVFGDGLAVALLFAVLSFAGFEATAIFAEESRRPRRTVAVATFAVVVVMAGLFTVSSWSAIAAFDSGSAAVAASADTGTFFFAIGERYLGAWSVDVLHVLVVLSFFASVVAVHNMAARYFFALGRGGLLPGWLAETHHRLRTPYRAGFVQTGVTVTVLALFSATGAEPLTDIVPALAGLFTLVFLVLMTGTSLAVVRAFRTRLPAVSRWSTLVAPLAAAALLATTTVLLVANYSLQAGSDALVVTLLPWLVFGAAAVATVVCRRSHDARVP